MEDSLRVDVLLHRLCLTKSRSEAKAACEAGAVMAGAKSLKASHEVAAGQELAIRYPRRQLVIRIDRLPPKSTARKVARELYSVLRDEAIEA